jgi:manganese-dependent inorganic pyrophosphatase
MDTKLTYIFGHKNPDTDSVCAAISFSYLKNKLGFNTRPAVLGDVNSETKYALDYFKFKVPYHLNDVKLQIKDVSYHKNCFIDKNTTIKDAFDYLHKHSLTGVGVVENKNQYYDYISLKEIACEVINGDFHKLETSYDNIVSVLKGNKVLKFDKEIKGNVLVTAYQTKTIIKRANFDKNTILITGDREDVIEYAINSHVKLIILVSNLVISNKLIKLAKEKHINIIKTPYNSYEVGKLISLSNYIKNFVRSEEESVTFNEVDYLSDFFEKSKKLKHTNYPIVNNKNECLGLLTLTDTNQIERKKVILVDHNNYSQSVDGLEEAEILEVIDHHSIGDIITRMPINFRTDRVGSVNTLIYNMFIEKNVKIPMNIAGLMMSAIISDTLLLTSPTTTDKDKEALIELSKLAKVDYKKYGTKLLKQGMSIEGLSNEEILYKDFKSYKVDNDMIGIGQVLTSDYDLINKDEMIKYLDYVAEKNNYKVLTLFITDIFNNISHCLYNKNAERIIKNSFDLDNVYEGIELKNTLSRKIQIAPYIMDAIDRD